MTKCDREWVTTNGVQGYVFRGKGDYSAASIFLPVTGIGGMTSISDANTEGYYWSSDHQSGPYHSVQIWFGSGFFTSDDYYCYRRNGQAIRPVQDYTVTVTFNLNYNGGGTTNKAIGIGRPVSANAPAVTREGWSLAGWSATPDGSAIGADVVAAEGATYYAIWARLMHTVSGLPTANATVTVDGMSTNVPASGEISVAEGAAVKVTPSVGYHFESFTAEVAPATIRYTLQDSYGDGWNANAIRVIDDDTGSLITNLTLSTGSSETGSLLFGSVNLRFEWVTGNFNNECSYTITGVTGEEILSGSGGFTTPVTYQIVLPPFAATANTDGSHSFTVPKSDVVVACTLVPTRYTVSGLPTANATVTVDGVVTNVPASGTISVAEGATVKVTPSAGYRFESFITSYSEGFEGGVMPARWSQEDDGSGVDWVVWESSPHTGSYCVHRNYLSSMYSGYRRKLITPFFDLSNQSSAMLEFWLWIKVENFAVYYRTSATDEWHTLHEFGVTDHGSWAQSMLMLPNLSSTYQIAFEFIDNYGFGMSIDDVTIAAEGAVDNADGSYSFTVSASDVVVTQVLGVVPEITATIAAINAIGDVAYTDESKAKIDAARTAYNALTDAQKALVANYATLTTAETTYAALKAAAEAAAAADAAAAATVAGAINAIGEVAYTDESKAKIDAARAAYDALTDAQKALVANAATLTAAEAAYAALTPAPEPQPEAPAEQVLYSEVAGAVDVNEASTWDGYLRSADGGVAGTFLAKIGKAGKGGKPSKVTLTLRPVGAKAQKYSGTMDASGRFTAAGGVDLQFGADSVKGAVGGYRVDGSRSLFVSKRAADKIAANTILVGRKQVYPVAWKDGNGWASLTVTVAAKGKAKATGVLANGTRVSANGQLLHGDGVDCVVVVSTKKNAPVVFALWFTADGIVVEGLGGEALAAAGVSNVANGATFCCGLLANGAAVAVNGKKWAVESSKELALKLTYTAKTGVFKGSFKVGAQKATVNGVVVGGKGYGSAVVKGAGSAEVTVEACNTCTR